MPHLTAKAAARRLGSDRELIEGLVTAGKVEGAVQPGTTGQRVVLLPIEEVERLGRLLGSSKT